MGFLLFLFFTGMDYSNNEEITAKPFPLRQKKSQIEYERDD